jgi:hypothetical protein
MSVTSTYYVGVFSEDSPVGEWIPEGEYWVGDPGIAVTSPYSRVVSAFNGEDWRLLVKRSFDETGRALTSPTGIYKDGLIMARVDVDGDGMYYGKISGILPVDSGTIGVVSVAAGDFHTNGLQRIYANEPFKLYRDKVRDRVVVRLVGKSGRIIESVGARGWDD